MRVGLTFPACNRRAGVERVMVECANYLASRGHETVVIAADVDPGVLLPDVKFEAVRAPGSHLLRLLTFAKSSERTIRDKHLNLDVLGGYGILTPPGGVVWAQSVHGAWIEISQAERGGLGRLKQKINPYHRICLSLENRYFGSRKYASLFALSERVKSDLERIYKVPGEHLQVLPNGFNPQEFSVDIRNAQRNRVRQSLGFNDSDRVIVFAANELQRKGFFPLLEAIASLNDPALRLLAVGRLNQPSCKDAIDRLGLKGRVVFTGPSSDIAGYYAASDLFALPTIYEAWGLVIVEAMACGLPVVTSRLAGASIAVREGLSGCLLDDPSNPGEIAERLATLLNGTHATASEISQSVQDYTWDRILLRYENHLAEVAERSPFSFLGSSVGS